MAEDILKLSGGKTAARGAAGAVFTDRNGYVMVFHPEDAAKLRDWLCKRFPAEPPRDFKALDVVLPDDASTYICAVREGLHERAYLARNLVGGVDVTRVYTLIDEALAAGADAVLSAQSDGTELPETTRRTPTGNPVVRGGYYWARLRSDGKAGELAKVEVTGEMFTAECVDPRYIHALPHASGLWAGKLVSPVTAKQGDEVTVSARHDIGKLSDLADAGDFMTTSEVRAEYGLRDRVQDSLSSLCAEATQCGLNAPEVHRLLARAFKCGYNAARSVGATPRHAQCERAFDTPCEYPHCGCLSAKHIWTGSAKPPIDADVCPACGGGKLAVSAYSPGVLSCAECNGTGKRGHRVFKDPDLAPGDEAAARVVVESSEDTRRAALEKDMVAVLESWREHGVGNGLSTLHNLLTCYYIKGHVQ
jgi:hypothetical protein